MNPFDVVRQFEAGLAAYTGAPFVVTTTSCTAALMLAVAWHMHHREFPGFMAGADHRPMRPPIEIPRRTYIGVGHSIVTAGARPTFIDAAWIGEYPLHPLPVIDCARWLRGGMYRSGTMMCLSFHPAKHLGISTHGGAILLDDPQADAWLRKTRFDGRTEGVEPKNDTFDTPGFHVYMAPPTAAEGLERLSRLPWHNEPLPNSEYSDLSIAQVFK